MAKIGLPKGSGKRLKVGEKSVKSQGILKWILRGNPVLHVQILICSCTFILHVQFNKEYSVGLSSLGFVASNHWIHRPMDDILG